MDEQILNLSVCHLSPDQLLPLIIVVVFSSRAISHAIIIFEDKKDCRIVSPNWTAT